MAGLRFPPGDFAVQESLLERAASHPMLVVHKNARSIADAGGRVVSRFPLEHTVLLNNLKMLLAEVFLYDRKGGADFIKLIVAEGCPPAPVQGATSAFAAFKVASEFCCGDCAIYYGFLNKEHSDSRFSISLKNEAIVV
jgi:hypothetical protein